MKLLALPIFTWNGTLKSKKKSLKFEQQNELLLKGTLKTFRACGAYFLREFAIHEYKSLPQAENF